MYGYIHTLLYVVTCYIIVIDEVTSNRTEEQNKQTMVLILV